MSKSVMSKIQFIDHPTYPHTIMTELKNILPMINHLFAQDWKDSYDRPGLNWHLTKIDIAYIEGITTGLPLGIWIEIRRRKDEHINDCFHYGSAVIRDEGVTPLCSEVIDGKTYVIFKRTALLENIKSDDRETMYNFARDEEWTNDPAWWAKEVVKIDHIPFTVEHFVMKGDYGFEAFKVTGDVNDFLNRLETKLDNLPEVYEQIQDVREVVHDEVKRSIVIRGMTTGKFYCAHLPDTYEVSWDDVKDRLKDTVVDFWRVVPTEIRAFRRWEGTDR
jgi:hypothetical protein